MCVPKYLTLLPIRCCTKQLPSATFMPVGSVDAMLRLVTKTQQIVLCIILSHSEKLQLFLMVPFASSIVAGLLQTVVELSLIVVARRGTTVV
jgi:hypothetical protein